MRRLIPSTVALILVLCSVSAHPSPQLQSQNGTISGTLKTAAGEPASGVRVVALARPDAIADLAVSASFAALAETDAAGRYRLDNIPPGQYYVVAGRVDTPTYFPGAVQAADGKALAITPNQVITGVDFTLNNVSAGRADAAFRGSPSWAIPLQTRIEGGTKIPLFADGRFPVLRFTRANASSLEVPLTALNVTLPYPDYTVNVENLPDNYALKSLVWDTTDLRISPLALPTTSNGTTVVSSRSIVVTLTVRPFPSSPGVRVSGRIIDDPKRSIYISGKSGIIFSDGTFEFHGVPPGRHIIVTLDNPGADRVLGKDLVVGNQDLPNVELAAVSVAPAESAQVRPPLPPGNHAAGSAIAMSSIHGRVTAADTKEPFNAGRIVLNGNYAVASTLNDDGTFFVSNLLAGSYDVEAIIYGIGTIRQSITVDEQDMNVEMTLQP